MLEGIDLNLSISSMDGLKLSANLNNRIIGGYKRSMKRQFKGNTEHKNALLKLIKHKGMMLQFEAAKRLNRADIKGTVQILEEGGKNQTSEG
jgi:hypothetical protein